MCGIFGILAKEGARIERPQAEVLIEKLFLMAVKRGMEASGFAFRHGDRIELYKSTQSGRKMLESACFRSFLEGVLDSLFTRDGSSRGAPWAMIGHSRLVTNGSETVEDNNQPVVLERLAGVHNGIIVNDTTLCSMHPEISRSSDLDTEVLFKLLEKRLLAKHSYAQALRDVFSEIEGSASIAFLGPGSLGLGLATNTGSLYYGQAVATGLTVFSSEGFSLRSVASSPEGARILPSMSVEQLRPGQLALLELATGNKSVESLLADAAPGSAEKDFEYAGSPGPVIENHVARPTVLRRCVRCILPETYPGIEFDEHGVCSVCRRYEAPKLLGLKALEALADKYRSKDGSPDCLVSFSGGRDSAFALHYVKRVLGLNPIAYTFDWGMVTALARRNQARLCSKLGVEHIIRSPDIRAKRRNIRLNLNAWLHRPSLGMIPLLSAGDKHYYEYGRQLRKELGLKLTVFSSNELERTEFKTGFAKVSENKHRMVMYNYSMANKMSFIFYYMKQYLLNPRYINVSLFDTAMMYHYTYLAKDDFLYLFHYIPWDENEVVDTLVNEYGWEAAPDTNTTWRIDDAFTPFHNYIYYTVAGFSEHDTFRSNQIRADVISRDSALRMAEEENRPRIQAMREYAELIGVNLEEVLLKINAIPKLYEKGRR